MKNGNTVTLLTDDGQGVQEIVRGASQLLGSSGASHATQTLVVSPGQTSKVLSHIESVHRPGDKIILIGHSGGGGDIVDIARKLAKKNVPVEALIMIDSVEPFGNDSIIPNNVKLAVNFYQNEVKGESGATGQLNGESNIRAANSSTTKIINQQIVNPIGPAFYQEQQLGIRNIYRTHQDIDNDFRTISGALIQVKTSLTEERVHYFVPGGVIGAEEPISRSHRR